MLGYILNLPGQIQTKIWQNNRERQNQENKNSNFAKILVSVNLDVTIYYS